jgi:DNA-binding GntR family transcriptional regulator
MSAEPAPRSHKQLRLWVADRLRSAILEGLLKPGQWLRQEQLAQEYGVSQMPVREALKQLAAEGLVEHLPYRGVRVVAFSPEDVEDLYLCRGFIEGMAARFAAARITPEEVAELAKLHERMCACKTPEDLREYRDLNRRFHELIFSASGRSYLVRTLAQLWSAFPSMLWSNIPRIAVASVPGRDEPDTAEHTEIVAAFAARDPARAERAVRRHIEAAGKALASAMRAPTRGTGP